MKIQIKQKGKNKYFDWIKFFYVVAIEAIAPIALVTLITSNPTLAQITPDDTLGNESSRVTRDVTVKGSTADLIEGGALRGSSLFHSFREFNVNDGTRVYFGNPTGIENIFSRVTGNSVSNIFGTLGVNGSANLYLLNPNGILFGKNAQLDIQGSFFATTANSFQFPDGSEFSATNPQPPQLLTISVPVGVQYGSQPTASITNQGNLLTGKDLTLSAGNLDLQGQLQAGGNLTLQAQDTLKVRDSVSNPFIAAANGKMVVQGNQKVDIFALNHPNSGFFSGGDMVLRSSNAVGGDAYYWAGGTFRIEQLDSNLGNLLSPKDPVIRAIGDVSFDSYTGASLHILTGGSVNISGNVNITGADTSDFVQETVTLSDGTTLEIDGSTTPTLDIRAGVDSNYIGTPNFIANLPTGFNLQNPTTTNTPTNANITIEGNIDNPGGLIFLTNQYQPNLQLSGDIKTQQINSGRKESLPSENGGNIVIESKGNITIAQIFSGIDNDNRGAVGNAGDIIIQASGNIAIGSTDLENKPNSGAINASVIARNGTYNAGNSGKIQITSTNADITVRGGIFTNSTAVGEGSTAGNTGDITLQARQGTVQVTANQAGAIVTRAKNDVRSGITGNAGNITIDAKKITIIGRKNNQTDFDVTSESALTGESGKITLISQTPLELNDLTIGTDARDGKGGNIEINAPSLTITNSKISTTTDGKGKAGDISITKTLLVILDKKSQINTDSKSSGNAGYIQINASDKVSIFNGSKIYSQGNNGNIDISAGSFDIQDKSEINTNSNGSEYAGNIKINASDQVSFFNESKIFSQGNNGWILIGEKYQPKTIILDNESQINTNSNGSEYAGFVKINASEQVSIFNGSKISSQGNNGYINITTDDLSVTNGAQIDSSLIGTGNQVGSINIEAKDSVLLQGNSTLEDKYQTGIFTQISQGGQLLPSDYNNKGNITIKTNKLIINDGARLSADTYGTGDAGDINIYTQQIELQNQGRIISVVREGANGNSGNIELKSLTLSLTDDARISVSNLSKGNAGNITINATDSVLLKRKGRISSSVRNTGTGKGGDIKINTNLLRADGGIIDAQNQGQGNGGNIAIETRNLLLRNQSKIRATAGSITNPGNGGSITINAKDGFVIAVPSEDSDIIANAFGGNGGKININANRILGFQKREKLSQNDLQRIENNSISDISASSDVGEDGEVSLNNLSIDPSQGLVALPTDLIDPSGLIAQGCGAGNGSVAKGRSEFVITGRGGLPPSPDDALSAGVVSANWVNRATNELSNNNEKIPVQAANVIEFPSGATTPLVEAVGMVRNSNGDIVLTAQPTTASQLQSGLFSTFCSVSQK